MQEHADWLVPKATTTAIISLFVIAEIDVEVVCSARSRHLVDRGSLRWPCFTLFSSALYMSEPWPSCRSVWCSFLLRHSVCFFSCDCCPTKFLHNWDPSLILCQTKDSLSTLLNTFQVLPVCISVFQQLFICYVSCPDNLLHYLITPHHKNFHVIWIVLATIHVQKTSSVAVVYV